MGIPEIFTCEIWTINRTIGGVVEPCWDTAFTGFSISNTFGVHRPLVAVYTATLLAGSQPWS